MSRVCLGVAEVNPRSGGIHIEQNELQVGFFH